MTIPTGTEVTATVRGEWVSRRNITGLLLSDGTVLGPELLTDVTPVETAEQPALRSAEHFVRWPDDRGFLNPEHVCACGLDTLDPIHLRSNGRNSGRQPWISNFEAARVNVRRREHGMPEITRSGTAAVCP